MAERLDHKFSIAEAFGFSTTVHYFRGEHASAMRCAERAIEVCEEGGFAVWLAHAKLMHGRLLAERDAAAGNKEMQVAYEMWTSTGAVVTRAFYLALRAEGLAIAGRPDDGLALLREALDTVVTYAERYYEAEIRRLLGELTLQAAAARGDDRESEAEHWFLGALSCAQTRSLDSLALRSATSLGRLWQTAGRVKDAERVIKPVYAKFTEGLDTQDLRSARRLIEELDRAVNAA
ncbi:MAG: hypothetical protein M3Y67_00535 [Pseudomonadota bacterium]|nr:hypothetical protein [Pseudomonadota bacterium]